MKSKSIVPSPLDEGAPAGGFFDLQPIDNSNEQTKIKDITQDIDQILKPSPMINICGVCFCKNCTFWIRINVTEEEYEHLTKGTPQQAEAISNTILTALRTQDSKRITLTGPKTKEKWKMAEMEMKPHLTAAKQAARRRARRRKGGK